MPLFTKPQFNNVWASTGAKLTPDIAKISQGWVVEIPPHEFDNWMQNRQDALLAHLNQLGVPQWDGTVEYQAGKSYVQGTTTGVVYKALTTHSNVNPEIDIQNNWVVAFEGSGNSLLKVNNLSDVPDKAQARINLGIATTEFYDGRYLLKSANLADDPNKASARGNMDVYSRQEVLDLINNMQPAGEISAFARTTPPEGWLVCDGSIVSRSTFARLFAAIGATFGAGNGSTTFGLPDLRGEFIRGLDSGRGVDPSRTLGSWQDSENKSHIHSGTAQEAGEHAHGVSMSNKTGVNQYPLGATGVLNVNGYTTSPSGKHTHALTVGASGGGESRPRNVALLYCIRT